MIPAMPGVLGLLDHPTTSGALILVRRWTSERGHLAEADLAHALAVAEVLRLRVADVDPDVVAAALLQDSVEFAPSSVDLDTELNALSPEVARIVGALQHELDAAEGETMPSPPSGDLAVMQVSCADKIAVLQGTLQRARATADPAAFWARQQVLGAALSYLRVFHRSAGGVLSPPMVADLGDLITVTARQLRVCS